MCHNTDVIITVDDIRMMGLLLKIIQMIVYAITMLIMTLVMMLKDGSKL